ncbi:MAG: hypothetical protein RL385_3271, partial [Pseudomonadota bacterium]
ACALSACGGEDESAAAAPDAANVVDNGGTDAGSAGSSGAADAGSATSDGGGAGAVGSDAGSASGGVDGGSAAVASDAGVGSAAGDGGAGDSGTGDASSPGALDKFSFFVTSQERLVALAKKDGRGDVGFGGDLRYGGETGEGAGLRGADKICGELAEMSMPGSREKGWHAFLSTSTIDAKDRIGQGPWYDRLGRLVANNLTELIAERPTTAATEIKNDLPNETGTPNHNPGTGIVDNHDILTGTGTDGKRYGASAGAHCDDWTNSTKDYGAPRVGHSWPRTGGGGRGGAGGGSMNNWMSALDEAGCGAGINIDPTIDGPPDSPLTPAEARGTVGSGGGYGGFYCFASKP